MKEKYLLEIVEKKHLQTHFQKSVHPVIKKW